MKFIHTADLHIDSKIEYLPSSLSAIRREEVLHSFERLCDYAKQNDITAVIIAGDLFDDNKATKKTLERVKQCISLCYNIDFLYLQGNHDQLTNNSDFFADFPSNFKPFNEQLNSYRYENVVVSGIIDNASSITYEQINLNKEDYNILVMHGEVVNYKGKIKKDGISLPLLKNKNINYLALGHYHSFSRGELDLSGSYAYSGCLDGRGFDELGQKGFILIDTESEQKISFIPFSSREYIEDDINLTEYANWISARGEIINFLKGKYNQSGIIKVVLEGEISGEFNLDKGELEQRLREYFFYAKVEDKTILKLKESDYLLDKTVKGEFLRLVWESDLTDEQKKKVISCGLNALKGEDLI